MLEMSLVGATALRIPALGLGEPTAKPSLRGRDRLLRAGHMGHVLRAASGVPSGRLPRLSGPGWASKAWRLDVRWTSRRATERRKRDPRRSERCRGPAGGARADGGTGTGAAPGGAGGAPLRGAGADGGGSHDGDAGGGAEGLGWDGGHVRCQTRLESGGSGVGKGVAEAVDDFQTAAPRHESRQSWV